MTIVYFVRHAQPEHDWKEDRTRPLTEEGKKDSAIVLEFLKDKKIDAFYCSPYKRSMDTIADAAAFFGKEIITDWTKGDFPTRRVCTRCWKSVWTRCPPRHGRE